MVNRRNFVKSIPRDVPYRRTFRYICNESRRKRLLVILQRRIGNCNICENALPQNKCLCGNIHICNSCVALCIRYQLSMCECCR